MARCILTSRIALVLASGLALGVPAAHAEPDANAEPVLEPAQGVEPIAAVDGPVVQLALLLDTSNSMDGLIAQAKSALWAVVIELGELEHDGERPQLQVALYEYGNDSVSEGDGYVRMRTPFTTDLDLVSEQLFGLRTNGGREFCGVVIDEAVHGLRWWRSSDEANDKTPGNAEPSDLAEAAGAALGAALGGGEREIRFAKSVDGPVCRIVVIAGNEPFTQGTLHYSEAIADAVSLGVTVNTVFCGPRREGANTGWEDGARRGGGLYTSIDQDGAVAEPPTPFDDRLSALNASLNATYLGFGERHTLARARQAELDVQSVVQANQGGGSPFARVEAKATANYVNSHWDLVDAVKVDDLDLATLDDEQLPEDFRGLSLEDQLAKVNATWDERQRVQAEIREVAEQRRVFIAEHHVAAEAPPTLAEVLTGAVVEQARRAGF
ncbi:MAG: VWA domain-containing protein [Planctomycetota bacterium]